MISSPCGCANNLLKGTERRDTSRAGDFSHQCDSNELIKRRSGRPTGLWTYVFTPPSL
jgi:hypothetical protein